MAGNSGRRGAVRKGKKGASVGTGGHGRRALEGRGPTPKAVDREYHPAHKRKKAAEAAAHKAQMRERSMNPPLRKALHLEGEHELVVGRNPVAEAVRAGVRFTRVFLVSAVAADERVAEVCRRATALGAPLIEVSRTELDKMCDGQAHQGIGIEIPPYEYCEYHDLLERAEAADRLPLLVALDGVTDPHNLGAVLRSAGAFGADGVLLPVRRSAGVNAAAWKVSAGAAARVPVARTTNLVRAIEELKAAGCFVVGLDGKADVQLQDLQLTDVPLVLVTGAEGEGLSRLVRATCDQVVAVEMSEVVESLNAAVATGICLYTVAIKRAQALQALNSEVS